MTHIILASVGAKLYSKLPSEAISQKYLRLEQQPACGWIQSLLLAGFVYIAPNLSWRSYLMHLKREKLKKLKLNIKNSILTGKDGSELAILTRKDLYCPVPQKKGILLLIECKYLAYQS